MLDLLKPLARLKLFTCNELPHGVEGGSSEVSALGLVSKFLGGKLADEICESFGHFGGVRVSIS
jgi:hypothetical protein